MKGQIRSLECVSSVFRKAAVCPACPKASILCECMSYHKVIVSLINRMVESSQSHWMPCLDCAVRKQQVAASVHGPLNAGIVFDDQSQVNTFIDNYKPKKDATEKV